MQIKQLDLHVIYNSRVQPTVEAVVDGARAAAPSGASTGTHEALCFVPDDLASIEEQLQAELVGEDLTQAEFDARLREVDGTDNFAELGAASIASSFAFRKAQGFDAAETFPYPLGNLVGGGAHGGSTAIQEFLVCPVDADTVPEAMETLSQIFNQFKEEHARDIQGVNDEGAFVTSMDDEATLRAVTDLAEEFGARVGIDAAASEFYEDGTYYYETMGEAFAPEEQVRFMKRITDQFDLFYVEDPFDEDAYEEFAQLMDEVTETLVVGDDLFVTQETRLRDGAAIDAGNAIIVKPNQVGTVTGAREALQYAQDNGFAPVISHRSGETCDPVIADLAIQWGAPLMKAGISGIRTAKNNQLLRRWHADGGEMADLPV